MRLSTRILLGFAIVLILSILDTASNYLLSLKVEKNIHFLNKSQDIIRNSGNLHRAMIDMQSSFRGYLLTDDSSFLDGYLLGLSAIPPLVTQQQNLVENKQQLSILNSIKSLHMQWVGYANGLIDSRSKSPSANKTYQQLFEDRLKKQVGKKLNDNIAQYFLEFDQMEYGTRIVRSENLMHSIRRTHLFSLGFFLLTIIVGIATTAYIVSLISKRIKTMVNLAENISRGEFTTVNDQRRDELTSLSTSLNIMSDNLRRNISELENSNAELDKFAYVVSHDLKAPIRGIHNIVTWIEEDLGYELSSEMKNYLSLISGRTERMENLINGLLDYARIRKRTASEEVDVAKLVDEIVADIVPRNILVRRLDLPVFFTERLKLQQVFTNLISNAVKFVNNENGEIVIRCKELKYHYEFSVKDNGIGIEPQYHDKIFEMFQTLRGKDEKESTGIGLAIIKKIIDDQQGTINVISELGHGAEFIFTWPRTDKST